MTRDRSLTLTSRDISLCRNPPDALKGHKVCYESHGLVKFLKQNQKVHTLVFKGNQLSLLLDHHPVLVLSLKCWHGHLG